MTLFDIVIITILSLGLLRGIFRGLVREAASIIGVLGGFYAAYTYYPHVAQLVAPWISSPSYRNILGYLAIFMGVVTLVAIFAAIIKYLLNIAYMGWVDRLSGAFFGLLKAGLVVCVLFIALTAFLPKESSFIKHAVLAPYVADVSQVMAKVVSKEMKTQFNLKVRELKAFWQTR